MKSSYLGSTLAALFLTFIVSYILSYAVQGQSAPEPIQKGMGIIAYYQGVYPQMDQHLATLAETGTEWVSVYVTVYQNNINSTTITRTRAETPTDDDLRHIIDVAHAQGLKVMLKPQIDLYSDPGNWRGQIGQDFTTEAQWSSWFASYDQMIAHYAALATETNVEEFTLGTELVSTTHRATEWRDIVATVRSRYAGKVLYAANHSGEEIRMTWWDAVDYIGLAAYYEVGTSETPTVAQLKTAWAPHIETLANLSAQYNKQVIFVEIGYRSVNGALMRPWCYLCTGPVDLEEQAVGYQALYESLWHQPWFAGLYWWRWDIEVEKSGPCDSGYSPYNKPAENVMRSWYGGATRSVPTQCGGSPATPTQLPTRTPTETATPFVPPTATARPTALPATNTPVPPTLTPTVTPTVTPATEPPADGLSNGWADWSWGTTVDFNQADVTQRGSGAIAATYTDGWGGLYLRSQATHNLTLDHHLHFWIRGTTNGQAVNVSLVAADATESMHVRITPVANSWAEVIIPLRAFGTITSVTGVIWQDALGITQPTYYLDEVTLRSAGAVPTFTPTHTPSPLVTATATPGPSGASGLTVFDDALRAGWVNWSWGSAVDFAAQTVVHEGESAIGTTYTDAWAGLFLGHTAPLDLSSYDQLHFWIYGNGRAIDVKLASLETTKSVRLRIVPAANTWSEVLLPLQEFGDFTQIGGIAWQEGNGAPQPRFYLDEIAFRTADQSGRSGSTLPFEIITEEDTENPIDPGYLWLPLVER